MQFKKETTLSSSFQSRLKFERGMGMPEFLEKKFSGLKNSGKSKNDFNKGMDLER